MHLHVYTAVEGMRGMGPQGAITRPQGPPPGSDGMRSPAGLKPPPMAPPPR
jgi:hypothetical protein